MIRQSARAWDTRSDGIFAQSSGFAASRHADMRAEIILLELAREQVLTVRPLVRLLTLLLPSLQKCAGPVPFPTDRPSPDHSADQVEQMVRNMTEFASMTKDLLVTKSNGRSCTGRTIFCTMETRRHGRKEALAASLKSNFEK